MIWALGTDDHNGQSCGGEKYPLTRTISNCMKSATPTQQRLTQGPPSATRPPSVTNWKPATQPHPVRTLPPVVWTPAPTRSPGSGSSGSCSGLSSKLTLVTVVPLSSHLVLLYKYFVILSILEII